MGSFLFNPLKGTKAHMHFVLVTGTESSLPVYAIYFQPHLSSSLILVSMCLTQGVSCGLCPGSSPFLVAPPKILWLSSGPCANEHGILILLEDFLPFFVFFAPPNYVLSPPCLEKIHSSISPSHYHCSAPIMSGTYLPRPVPASHLHPLLFFL